MTGRLLAAFAFLLCLKTTALQAQVANTPNLSFDGYGTLGLVYSDEDQADFVSGLFDPEGAGFTDKWSPEVDSRIAVQATAELGPRLSGIVQVIAEQRYDDTYQPQLEWANLKYQATPELSLRVGRTVLPAFMTSEYRKVGFAIPWVRPPPEVYRQVPVTNMDGISARFRTRIAGVFNTFRAVAGVNDIKFPSDGGVSELQARDSLTLSNTVEWDATTLFASYNRTSLTADGFAPLFDGFRQFGADGRAIADDYDFDDKDFEFIGVGVRYEPGDWFVIAEGGLANSRTFVGDTRGWYVTGGYRIGSFTPYATFARAGVESNTSDPGLSLAGLPPPAAARAGELNARLNELLGTATRQKSLALGLRWDVARNAALKFQYDHIDLDEGSAGVLTNTQAGFRPGGTVNLFSVTVDFVF